MKVSSIIVETEFRIAVHTDGRKAVLELFGELDIASSSTLESKLAGISDAALVVIDLRPLEFIDSTGLGVLVRAHRRAQDAGREFALVRGTGQVDRLLVITGLADQLPVVETSEELMDGS